MRSRHGSAKHGLPGRAWLRVLLWLTVVAWFDASIASDDVAGLAVLEGPESDAGGIDALRSGDRLLSWRAQEGEPESERALDTAIEFAFLQCCLAPAQPLLLRRRRAADGEALVGLHEDWRLRVAPALDRADEQRLKDAFAARDGKQGSLAYAELSETLAAALAPQRSADALWLELEAGRERVRAGDRVGAARLVRRARERLPALPPERAGAAVFLLAQVLRDCGEYEETLEWLDAATARLPPHGHAALRARLLLLRGVTLASRARHDDASADYTHAVSQLQATMPNALLMVELLFRRANVASFAGRPREARVDLQQAQTILRLRGEEGRLRAEVAGALGVSNLLLGDLAGAEVSWQEALRIFRARASDDYNIAKTLNALGIVATQRGALRKAEAAFDEALQLARRSDPGTAIELNPLANRSYVYSLREEHAAAIADQRRVVELRRVLAPDSTPLSQDLHNLATRLERAGHGDAATDYFRQALELKRRLAPDSAQPASTLLALGVQALGRGELDAAQLQFDAAMALIAQHAPGGLDEAALRFHLAEVALARRDADAALPLAARALALRETLAPQGWVRAESEHLLGRIQRARGDDAAARAHFEAAVQTLEAQLGLFGGTELSRARFRARYRQIYKDLIELEAQGSGSDAAFVASERYRSGELALLVDAEVAPQDPDYAALREAFSDAVRRYDRRLAETAGNATDETDIDGSLDELAARRDALRARLRNSRLGPSLHPVAPSVAQVAQTLAPDTAFLSYVALADVTLLFVLTRGEDAQPILSLHRIPLGRDALDAHVARLRLLLRAPDAPAPVQQAWRALAAELATLLVAPARPQLRTIRHLAIAPDAGLHLLPFAALRLGPDDCIAPQRECHLVERYSLRLVGAATQVAHAPAQVDESIELLAIADPDLSHLHADSEPGSAPRRSPALGPLPGARDEARAVAEIFAPRARLRLDAEASERNLKREASGARVLHLATHAVLDHALPLDSYLALSPDPATDAGSEARENGLLQAWEVIEQLRLDRAIVVLSGCDTARGADAGGEGLLGMTRAFALAGARDVVATYWPVEDRSSAALVATMFRHWRGGEQLHEALARAQRERVAPPDAPFWTAMLTAWFESREPRDDRHPFYWAGYALHGGAP